MKKKIMTLTVMLTLIGSLTACGSKASGSSGKSVKKDTEKVHKTSAENLTEDSDTDTTYDSYEDALAAYYGYVADKDYEKALSVMMPEKACSLITYMYSEDELIEEYFDDWDIGQKISFKEVTSEESMDKSDKRELLTMLNAEFYCFDQVIEKYDELPEPEELEEELDDMFYQISDNAPDDCPDYISDIREVNIRLTDSHDVDYYHRAFVYLIDGEGWRVAGVEEDSKDEWQSKINSLFYLGDDIGPAAADSLNKLIGENKFELAERDWSSSFVISNDPEYCFQIDKDAAKVVCEDIVANVEGVEDCDFFVAFNGTGLADIIICRKDDHKNICITPSGLIEIGDEYVNASDLTYEKACELYLQNLGG